jgi:hypothetical protein
MIEICAKLKRLLGIMFDVWYRCFNSIMHRLEEEEKVIYLSHHSEKIGQYNLML